MRPKFPLVVQCLSNVNEICKSTSQKIPQGKRQHPAGGLSNNDTFRSTVQIPWFFQPYLVLF